MAAKEYTEIVIKARLIGPAEDMEDLANQIKNIADTEIQPLLDLGRDDKMTVDVNTKHKYD